MIEPVPSSSTSRQPATAASSAVASATGATSPRTSAPVVPAASRTFTCADDVQSVIDDVRTFYRTGTTRPVSFRIEMLRRLKDYLKDHEDEILGALRADLGKSDFEGYATELGLVYDEINMCVKNVKRWAKPKMVYTPLVHFPSVSRVFAQPFGVVAVLSPWNYPIQLALNPMVDAIAAGNCVVLKPSRTSKATNAFLAKLCREVFPENYVYCLPGSGEMNDWILQVKFDKIFFTGSPAVGHQIMEAASKHLTHVTMELGGKSPCIVDATANIKRAGQRIAWGKCINSGQTCVAPDYFLVHEDVLDEFVREVSASLRTYYGQHIIHNPEFPHMINRHHYDRVCGLIDSVGPNARVVFGGSRDPQSLKIEPTLITGISLDDPVMQEEIFGPVLPIITFSDLDEALNIVENFPSPLACYLFSEDKAVQQRVIDELPFGGGTINDVVIHLANNHMGFGGLDNSGIGAYHGKKGFECFTHFKSTLRKGTWLEVPVRVPPFKGKMGILRFFMH